MFKHSVLLALALTLATSLGFAHQGKHAASDKALETQLAMRDLWIDHIFWTRAVTFATARGDKASSQAAIDQVVANAKAIAGAIEPFYGKDASDQLFKLLAGHWGAISDYLNATIPKKNSKKQKTAVDALTANAKELAKFLSGANPHLPEATLISLLAAHGGHHVSQINQVAGKDYKAEARTWEDMKGHIYSISDALVGAIAKQFPKKF